MKTINLLAVILITTICSVSYASTTGVDNTNVTIAKSRISEIIISKITFPEVVINEKFEGLVLVNISFDENNKVVINEINASDERLKAHVQKQLSKLVIQNAKNSINDGNLNYKFIFKKKQ